jgi:hypothetical protein
MTTSLRDSATCFRIEVKNSERGGLVRTGNYFFKWSLKCSEFSKVMVREKLDDLADVINDETES